MASKSTNIHAQGFTFPGEMKKYCWEFPPVSVPMKRGNKMITTHFYVGMLNSVVAKDLVSSRMNSTKGQKANPSYIPGFTFANFALELNDQMLDHSPISGIAFYVTSTQQGDGKVLFRDMTFVMTGKSLGRKNRTNVFTQALADVLSKYNAKINVADQKTQNVVTPMLAYGEGISDRDAIREEISGLMNDHLATGLYVQPKYDGVRVLSTLNPANFPNNVVLPFESTEDVICYSRKGKPIMLTSDLREQLKGLLTDIMEKSKMTSLILDGEYYYHGMPLQEISGYARGTHDSERKFKVNLYIYDYCDRDNTTYDQRHDVLIENGDSFDSIAMLTELLDDGSGTVKLSETKLFYNTDDVMTYYDATIDAGYEGIMIRLPSGVYESARSKNLIKIKPTISFEYECVGYEFGIGKDKDIPTIKCKVGTEGISNANAWWFHKNGKSSAEPRNKDLTFSAKFKGMTEVEQRLLGAEFQEVEANGKTRFENRYLGKKVEIEFLNFSVDGKPEKPNCKQFVFDK